MMKNIYLFFGFCVFVFLLFSVVHYDSLISYFDKCSLEYYNYTHCLPYDLTFFNPYSGLFCCITFSEYMNL